MTEQHTTEAKRVCLLPVEPDGIPDYLKIRPQFVGWKAQPRPDGKFDKVPMIAGTNRRASSTDLLTWSPFEEAYEAYEAGKHDGIGFVLCSADPFVGIDLDDCRDPESGAILEWARAVIDKFGGAYVEASPSGRGVHIIARGRLRGGKRRGAVEVYGQDRFLTVTGVRA